jgi:hypothetical protein
VAQVVECLPSKFEALSSNSSTDPPQKTPKQQKSNQKKKTLKKIQKAKQNPHRAYVLSEKQKIIYKRKK